MLKFVLLALAWIAICALEIAMFTFIGRLLGRFVANNPSHTKLSISKRKRVRILWAAGEAILIAASLMVLRGDYFWHSMLGAIFFASHMKGSQHLMYLPVAPDLDDTHPGMRLGNN